MPPPASDARRDGDGMRAPSSVAVDGFKKCPDCAEMVRAEARVCRFCGYRFDGARRSSGGSALGDLLRRPRVEMALPEVLAEWGFFLGEDETVAYFGYGRLNSAYGFLAITDRRVAFFSGRRGRRMLDWARADVRAVEPRRGWGGRQLRLSGPRGGVTLGRFESRHALETIAQCLGPPIETR